MPTSRTRLVAVSCVPHAERSALIAEARGMTCIERVSCHTYQAASRSFAARSACTAQDASSGWGIQVG